MPIVCLEVEKLSFLQISKFPHQLKIYKVIVCCIEWISLFILLSYFYSTIFPSVNKLITWLLVLILAVFSSGYYISKMIKKERFDESSN
jgi:cytochrome c oxidase subunit IV